MKHVIILFLVFAFTSCSEHSKNNNTSTKSDSIVKNMDWLVGDWKRTNDKEGNETFEFWKKQSFKEYIGKGFTLQNQDTIFMENIRIILIDDVWNFEVIGVNEAPTLFPFTAHTATSFVCENHGNEFPKKIKYELKDKKLQARISGGGPNISFLFEKYEK